MDLQFPPSAIKDKNIFEKTDTDTFCPWKGHAAYYTIKVGGALSAAQSKQD